jgi:hypothetical protein
MQLFKIGKKRMKEILSCLPAISSAHAFCLVSCSLYDLANVVPTLAKFYHQASEAYEQACTRHIAGIITGVYIHSFLFLLATGCSLKFDPRAI